MEILLNWIADHPFMWFLTLFIIFCMVSEMAKARKKRWKKEGS